VAPTKKKSVDAPTNKRLREVALELKLSVFDDKQNRTARSLGVSGAYLSEFLGGTRGAGVDLITGLSKYRPLEVLRTLGINPRAIALLLSEEEAGLEMGAYRFPDELRRAARAAMELLGCTSDEVLSASEVVYAEYGDRDDADPDWWLGKIRQRVPPRTKSGVHKKTK
jgi:transcriptional regulator with XRE-family HTH domain